MLLAAENDLHEVRIAVMGTRGSAACGSWICGIQVGGPGVVKRWRAMEGCSEER